MICICILQSRLLYYSSVGNSMFIKHVRNGQWQTVDESPKRVCFFERKNVGAFIIHKVKRGGNLNKSVCVNGLGNVF